MRESRPGAVLDHAAAPHVPVRRFSGGETGYGLPASAADRAPNVVRAGSASGLFAETALHAPAGWEDPGRPTGASPSHRPTVTGAETGRIGTHVGGGMLPPAARTVALSDGTRISFRAVEELPGLEVA